MERKLRRCAVCGAEYRFCPKCNEDKDKPLYHYTFCSKNCRDIYSVISSFEDKEISAEETLEKLMELDLSRIDSFNDSYKDSLERIYNSAVPKKSKKKNKSSESKDVKTLDEQQSEEVGIYGESKGIEETYVE